MIQKRVIIGSFILIIAGLFFMLGVNGGITGAVIGTSTNALSSSSGSLLGFFLIWIASFMLIANTGGRITLDKLVETEEKVQKDASKEYLKTSQDYVHTLDTIRNPDGTTKEYENLTPEELDKIHSKVEQERILRYFGNWSSGAQNFYKNALSSNNEEEIMFVKDTYMNEVGITREDEAKVYQSGLSLEAEQTLSDKAGKGMIKKRIGRVMKLIDDKDLEKIVGKINQNLNDNYDINAVKENPNLLGQIYADYKQEISLRQRRQQRPHAQYTPHR